MAHANKERMGAGTDCTKAESIKITEFWEEQLKAMPYLSRKYFFFCRLNFLSRLQRRAARPYTC